MELPTKDIVLRFQDAIDQCQSVFCDDRQIILRNLSDENVWRLSELEGESYPDHSRSYSLVPAFEKENAEKLFQKICGLSNKGRYEFIGFLKDHYRLNAGVDFWKEYFQPDSAVLESLHGMLVDVPKSKESVEGLSYRHLVETLSNVIKRCNGEI